MKYRNTTEENPLLKNKFIGEQYFQNPFFHPV